MNDIPEFEDNRDSYSFLVVECKWNGQGFMMPINSLMSYASLYNEIRRRFSFRRNEVIMLRYSLPGCDKFFLNNEADFKMIFAGAKVYNLEKVEISISKQNGKSALALFGPTHIADEDDFLDLAYRSEAEKCYLSDEWCGYIKEIGQKFKGGIVEFRDRVKKYAVGVGFYFNYQRNDGVYVHVVCSASGCMWQIKGAVASCNGAFYIHEMDKVHTCGEVGRRQTHSFLDSEVVTNCIEKDIMYNGMMRPKEIQAKFKVCFGFDISYKVAINAKQKAMNNLYGSEADSFNKLRWFRDAVMETNPGSYFELEVDPETKRFKRLFLAYGGCIDGFEYCLPVLYVDGTFGKSMYKGQILSATGRNGNKGFYPLAMCVCDSESEDNWYYFFWNLRNVINRQGRVITFISDRGHGLLSAFDKVFPGNPHLYCYKHLAMNLAKRYQGRGNSVCIESVKTLFFKVAYASSVKQYEYHLKLLREEGKEDIINPFLAELPVQNWCRAFFVGCRYGIMANGIAESFNSWIRLERAMPVYCMLEQTRLKEMQMISNRSEESKMWTTFLTPQMEVKLQNEIDKSRSFSVHNSAPGVYEVRSIYAYDVNLNNRTCSCAKWQINCFPCSHALAAIQKSKTGDVYKFVDSVFHTETFRKAYSIPINPVTNVDESVTEPTADYIHPPIAKRPPGRRRTKRIKSGGEFQKKMITCGRCHKKGSHNKLTCTEAIEY